MVGGLRAGREPDRHAADRLGHLGQQGDELVVALDRDGRAVERGDGALRVGERDERMERADLRPGRHRRREDLGAEQAARVDDRLPAVQPEVAGHGADGVVGHGQDDELDLVEERGRLGERPRPGDEAPEPLASAGSRLATAAIGQPARVSATPSAVPTAPAPTIPMSGGSPGSA